MKSKLIDAGVVLAILSAAFVVSKCTADTNKVEAPTTLSLSTTGSVSLAVTSPTQQLHVATSGTAELKTDGPLSHFQLFGMVESQKILIRRVDTIVTVEVSNTYTRAFYWDTNAGAWRTNDRLPSAIGPVFIKASTNEIDVPIQRGQ